MLDYPLPQVAGRLSSITFHSPAEAWSAYPVVSIYLAQGGQISEDLQDFIDGLPESGTIASHDPFHDRMHMGGPEATRRNATHLHIVSSAFTTARTATPFLRELARQGYILPADVDAIALAFFRPRTVSAATPRPRPSLAAWLGIRRAGI